MKKGMLIVTDLAIALLCAAGLFLTLLEDRFRLWATVACYGAAYLLSLGVGWIAARLAGPSWAVAAGALVLFGASLFLSRNNPLQKFYLVLLTLACHFYLEAFLPPALALCAVGNGKVDFLFRLHIPAQRLLVSTLLFAAVIFVFRSVYQAGRFRQGATEDSLRAQMLALKAGDYTDTLAAVQAAKAAQKAGEYALDTVSVMVQDGNQALVPRYAAIYKSPLAGLYSQNPYVNGVIAAKAAFAAQNSVSFESNAFTGETPLTTVELCVLISEMLTRACGEAAAYEGERRVRFTAQPGENSLTMEAVYSGQLPQKETFSLKGKTLSQVLGWLFDENTGEDDFHGLENARDIVERYSGNLSLSGAPGEVILRMSLRF